MGLELMFGGCPERSFDSTEFDMVTIGGSTTDHRYIADGATWQHVIQRRYRLVGQDVVRTLLDSYQGIMEKDLATYEKRLTIQIAKVTEFGPTPIFVTQPFRRIG